MSASTSNDNEPIVQPTKRSRRRRVVVRVIAALIVLGSGLAYRYFWLERPVGSGPAGPTVERARFETEWTTRPVLLVGLGDSVTAGFGASSRRSYFHRLVSNPPDEFPAMQGVCLSRVLPNLEAQNLALSGTTSLECLQMLIPKLPEQDDQTIGIIVLTTGGNDIIHNYGRTPPREGAMYGATFEQAQPWIANFRQRLHTILDEIDARFPAECHVFLADIYDPTDGVGDAENAGLPQWSDGLKIIRAYNQIIEETVAERDNVYLVGMHDAFLGHGIHCAKFWSQHYDASDPHYWYFDNLEDPNDRGYDALRRLFLQRMAAVLPDKLEAHALAE